MEILWVNLVGLLLLEGKIVQTLQLLDLWENPCHSPIQVMGSNLQGKMSVLILIERQKIPLRSPRLSVLQGRLRGSWLFQTRFFQLTHIPRKKCMNLFLQLWFLLEFLLSRNLILYGRVHLNWRKVASFLTNAVGYKHTYQHVHHPRWLIWFTNSVLNCC
uniref:Uncharacterized protein n=1 Tax=Opuntia streptacantha TaxID=393608 RepID=A0A7C9EJN0_OPUST